MKLSITEFTVLGIIWQGGPCTTYHVMRELAASPSTFYRNRAATAYRAVQGLIDEGFVESLGEERGARKDRQIQITAAGREVLEGWLSPPIPFVEVAHSSDLIRLRMYFIGAVDPPRRVEFIDASLVELEKHLESVTSTMKREEAAGDIRAAQASLGSVYETKARIEWLKAIR